MASCDDIAPLGTDGGLFSDYTNIIASALVIYEHSITFSQEMRVIWQRRRTLVSAIFLINRYNILCSAVIVLLLGTHAIENATIFNILRSVLDISEVLAYCTTAAFTALRVHALCGSGGKKLSLPILALASAPAVASVVCFVVARAQLVATSDVYTRCEVGLDMNPKSHMQLVWAGQFPSISADALVIVLTWIRTVEQFRLARELHINASLTTLILRDGTLYFAVPLALNASQLVVSRCLCISQIIYILSSVLMSRLLLNLRLLGEQPTIGRSTETLTVPSFVRPAGLHPDQEASFEDHEDGLMPFADRTPDNRREGLSRIRTQIDLEDP